MELSTATDLIAHEKLYEQGPQKWADLGCGTGTFTRALAHHLVPNSVIHAIDEDTKVLENIPAIFAEVSIDKHQADIAENIPELPPLDGILMANVFHYIQDKVAFINMWEQVFRDIPRFLIVEYDTARSNPWVPYPIGPDALGQLFQKMGYINIVKLGEIPSLYHNKIYASFLTKIP